ncbi:transposase [Pseudoroseomonas sp. WGS1072]|uniref:transposase n=1 Tax=Roseomonas sp. WGS1072 TaxID=3366816 RepID=UPI003BF16297
MLGFVSKPSSPQGEVHPRLLYHQRWHIESGLSQHKRRLGSALRARGHQAQRRELILRVLTHNLMILRSRPGRWIPPETLRLRRMMLV